MRHRIVLLAALTGLLWSLGVHDASAHAALQTSVPFAGSAIERAPAEVRLSFSEKPEAALSTVTVEDESGTHYETGGARGAADDPLSLVLPVGDLTRQVYTVSYRVVALDGHRITGSFEFGVGTLPAGRLDVKPTPPPGLSGLELCGRFALLAGLVGLLGHGVAALAGFGRGSGPLGPAAWASSMVGFIVLGEAQRRNAGASLADLWPTSVGHALALRGAAILVAGCALLVAPRWRRPATVVIVVAAASAMVVHVGAGHAAAARSWRSAYIAVQWLHVVAVGAWAGGLVALLVAVRGAPSKTKDAQVARFSSLALVALLVVMGTGVVGGFREIATWRELTSTRYGETVLVKSGLVLLIVALAAWNRRRHVATARTDLGPLVRTGTAEVAVALTAIVAAAVLAGSSPPAAARGVPRGLRASGHDRAKTVDVELTTPLALAGPNRFEVRVTAPGRDEPLRPDAVRLRFRPIDDAGVAATTLDLRRRPDGAYEAVGDNLAFNGRWGVGVLIRRGASSTTVPLEVETQQAPQFLSVLREPNKPAVYSVQIEDDTRVQFEPSSNEPGSRQLAVEWFDIIGSERPVDQMVLTLEHDGVTEKQVVRRTGPGRFTAAVRLREGTTTVTGITRTADGTRLRASFDLQP